MMEKGKSTLKRIFINDVDSYSSKYIAKFLSECAVGAHGEDEDDEESLDTDNKEKAFEIVGTVSEASKEKKPYVLEEYLQLKRDDLLPKLMECDVIVYNITQHQDQVDEAFGLLQEDEERPFTDEDFRRRRPHANFKAHNDLENKVVKLGKTTSWEGLKPQIPVFGDGTNIVPTIHINDLASVIHHVIEQRPRPYYLLAIDNSSHKMEEIVQAISKALGPGTIEKKPFAEIYLIREISLMETDCLTVNLRMRSVHLREQLMIPWHCERGLVENIDQVVEEYRQNRGLLPIRICVMGPPAVGKSTLSKVICDHYKLHHIKLKPTIAETIAKLKKAVSEDPSAEKESTAVAHEFLNNIKENMEQNAGVLEDQLLLKVVRDKLMTKPCLNQGFVLDGFPKMYGQAKEFYENEDADEEEEDDNTFKKILPEFVFLLDASDVFLKERVMNLPESEVEENNYEPDHFLKRLSRYRHRNSKDSTVADVYDELDITTLSLEITSNNDPNCFMVLEKKLRPQFGKLEEEARKEMEEKEKIEAQRQAEEEEREAEEARERAAHWEEWSKSLENLQRQEEKLLAAQTARMRSYLSEHVMPTLSQGLLACGSARPQDPLDFLAEYLIKNNPSNSTKL
ncbi:hypothetical protein WMY93_016606 [Mugilogobius chulae]|uniref:Nucleoside-diphosphate kinase n=1 Tax=Mugilogobius chulae TaxID=88201 RepID=A0AAW0NSD4_9GOBI